MNEHYKRNKRKYDFEKQFEEMRERLKPLWNKSTRLKAKHAFEQFQFWLDTVTPAELKVDPTWAVKRSLGALLVLASMGTIVIMVLVGFGSLLLAMLAAYLLFTQVLKIQISLNEWAHPPFYSSYR